MKLSGWGRFPLVTAQTVRCYTESDVMGAMAREGAWIPYGLGRSYGDSALAEQVLLTKFMDRLLSFNPTTGVMACGAGVSLATIIETALPQGWFLPVTPGTKYVTVGGAVASDVHGKNHHVDGCFSESVDRFDLMLPDGEIRSCSRDVNSELFLATCGGMGLTGVILNAVIRLRRVNSAFIDTRTMTAGSLHEIFECFEQYAAWHYLVAWVDCVATDDRAGRFLLVAGEHSDDGGLAYSRRKEIPVPGIFPSIVLNRWSIKLFNALYYRSRNNIKNNVRSTADQFFYPLDGLAHWNRMYGRNGLLQYQLVLPKQESLQGLSRIFALIRKSGQTPFLGVLKLMGRENDNLLTFPMEGYTLALDFKARPGVFALLLKLDRIVADHGGRLYLAKDARMGPEMLAGYPRLDNFRAIREQYGLAESLQSFQSKRLGI